MSKCSIFSTVHIYLDADLKNPKNLNMLFAANCSQDGTFLAVMGEGQCYGSAHPSYPRIQPRMAF